jgi:hypothetical protein
MLRKVPVIDAERLAVPDAEPDLSVVPPEEMLESLVARTANVRRIHRWRGLAAAAAAVIVALGGGAAIATALRPSPPPVVAEHWQRVAGGSASGVHLTVLYRTVESGTLIEANVAGLRPGAVCQLQVVDAHGNVMPLGSWQYRSGSSWYPASSALTEADLRIFELTIGGKVVASVHAD